MIQAEEPSGFPSAWYVCFFGTERRYWWDWLSPPGFYHVLAFAYAQHAERWLIYDVAERRTYVRAYTTEAFGRWLAGLPAGRRILLFEGAEQQVALLRRVGFWCTTGIAHLVGVRSRALRPAALYRDLLAQGAIPAFLEPYCA